MQDTPVFNEGREDELFFSSHLDQPVTMNAFIRDAEANDVGFIHEMDDPSVNSTHSRLKTHKSHFDSIDEGSNNNTTQLEMFTSDERMRPDHQKATTLNICLSPFSQSISSNITEPQILLYGRSNLFRDDSTWAIDPGASTLSNPPPFTSTPADLSLAASTAVTSVTTANTGFTALNNNNQITGTIENPRFTARNNVYASELPSHWNTEKLRNVCLAFGNIVSAKVVHDSATNKSRGYGFVMFETAEQAAVCVRSLNNCHVDGKVLACRLAHEKAMPSFAHIDRARPSTSTTNTPTTTALSASQANGSESIPSHTSKSTDEVMPLTPAQLGSILERGQNNLRKSRNVFIQGIPLHWNTDKLRNLCGSCGKVELAKVVRDSTTSLSCGHGFVLFEREEHAALCVETFNGYVVEGRTLMCRLVREKRNTPSPAMSSGGLTATPMLPPVNMTGQNLSSKDPLLVPLLSNVAPQQKMLDAVGTPSGAFVPMTAYGKWNPTVMAPACPTTLLQQPQPEPQGHATSSSTIVHLATQALQPPCDAVPGAGGSYPGFPACFPDSTSMQGIGYHLAPVPAFTNAYFIAVPYPARGPSSNLANPLETVSDVRPECMGCYCTGYS